MFIHHGIKSREILVRDALVLIVLEPKSEYLDSGLEIEHETSGVPWTRKH